MRTHTAAAIVALATSTALAAPDAINGELTNIVNYAAVGPLSAISAGVNLCNVGDEVLTIIANTNQHAITTQNVYRIDADGITHMGQSWVSHRFCALQQNACSPCNPAPGGGCAAGLGVGCSDVTSASLEGSQNGLSSRTAVNASTGEFNFPFPVSAGDAVFKRLQFTTADSDPALNPGARYVHEAVTIAPDDDNGTNAASYRELVPRANGGFIGFTGQTQRELPALYFWQEVEPDVRIEAIDIENDGRVFVASLAKDNGDGTWRYTYAVTNLNSHESVRALRVDAADASSPAFTDVAYHSGDTIDGTDWAVAQTAGDIAWSTDDLATNPNANAIRWATTYTFAFTSTQAPSDGAVEFTTYRSGLTVSVPANVPASASVCAADCDNSGTVDFNDLVQILFNFNLDFVTDECDPTNDDIADFNDLVAALFLFGPCE